MNDRKCFGMVSPQHHPPVESTLSLFCNLSEIATKMLDTFTCKGAEKQKAREWIVNEILWLSKVLWNDQVANNSKRDHIKYLAATALVTVINAEGSRYEQNLHVMQLLCMYVEYTEAICFNNTRKILFKTYSCCLPPFKYII